MRKHIPFGKYHKPETEEQIIVTPTNEFRRNTLILNHGNNIEQKMLYRQGNTCWYQWIVIPVVAVDSIRENLELKEKTFINHNVLQINH